LRDPPELDSYEKRKVDTMLQFSRDWRNIDRINYDHIVTVENMKAILGYDISENKAPYARMLQSKAQKEWDRAHESGEECPKEGEREDKTQRYG